MRLECSVLFAAVLFTGSAYADTPAYGKVETFQPGKKYNCVPTADHKAWNCNETGKAEPLREPAKAPASEPAPAPPAPAANATAAPPAAEEAPKAQALPSYLRNGAASETPPPPAAAAEAPPPPPVAETKPPPAQPVVETKPVVEKPAQVTETPAPAPVAAPTAAPTVAAEPPARTEKAPAPPENKAEASAGTSPKAAQISAVNPQPSPSEFLALAGDAYVIELARATSAGELAAKHAALQVPRGNLYEVHLRQNGSENWLLVWGAFDSVEGARAARDELAAQGAVTPGWPRRVGPLQAEARRISD
jgi:hypothetical protein